MRVRSLLMRASPVVCTMLAVVVHVSAVAAQPKRPAPEEPGAAFKRQGDEAMDALHYDEAIAAYTKAYEVGNMPAALYNRGRAHQARGQYVLALADIERFAR